MDTNSNWMADYYETLGVSREATPDEIKKAYRKLAKEYHPDRNNGSTEAESRFKELAEAYEVLKEPERRARYDRFGEAGVKGSGAGGPFQGGFDLHDAIEIFMRDFGGGGGGAGFEEIFGGGRRRGPRRSSAGETLQIRIPLTLADVVKGAVKKVRLGLLESCEACGGGGSAHGEPPEVCANCEGRGEERISQRSMFGQFVSVTACRACGGEGRRIRNPCATCHGEGRVRQEREIEVEVPPGVSSENYITLKGRGNVGPRGGRRGDVVALLEVEEDPRFQRDGRDLVTDALVTLSQAALGAEVEVPTVEGSTSIEVPAGIQSGQAIRVRGEGVPALDSSARGDLLVRIRVWVPTRLSHSQRDLFEQLQEIEDAPPTSAETGSEGFRGFWSRVRGAFSSS